MCPCREEIWNHICSITVEEDLMPEKKTLERAREDKREGKSPSTQAGEFVHEEIEHIREGKHGARSAKQAIAIGLSKARRAGVELAAAKEGEGIREDSNPGGARLREGPDLRGKGSFSQEIACHKGSSSARGSAGRLSQGALPSGARERQEPKC
jgi:hypothetical protein